RNVTGVQTCALPILAGDARDDRRELFDLETQGAGPTMLRRHLRLRAFLVAALGLLGGLAAAVLLAVLAVDLVTLTAGAALPEPRSEERRVGEGWGWG